MKCPACDRELRQIEAGGVAVDACEGGCGGLWFDNFELKKFDEPHESAGETLLDVARDENVVVDHSVRRKCPVCTDMIMMRHLFSPHDPVEIDECPGCGGVWLDAGELASIRTKFSSDEERNQAAQAWLNQKLAAQLDAAAKEDQQSQAGPQRIAHLLRFICPSYWIHGN